MLPYRPSSGVLALKTMLPESGDQAKERRPAARAVRGCGSPPAASTTWSCGLPPGAARRKARARPSGEKSGAVSRKPRVRRRGRWSGFGWRDCQSGPRDGPQLAHVGVGVEVGADHRHDGACAVRVHGRGGDGIEQRQMFGFHDCEPSPWCAGCEIPHVLPVRPAGPAGAGPVASALRSGRPGHARGRHPRLGWTHAFRPRLPLLCPVCRNSLRSGGAGARTLVCGAGHSFDAAKQGYFNFLVGKGTVFEADTADMVAARFDFLVRRALPAAGRCRGRACRARARWRPADGRAAVLDAGTGTGHYLRALLDRVAPDLACRDPEAAASGELFGGGVRPRQSAWTFPSSRSAAPPG